MLERLSIARFLGCLIEHIESGTGTQCVADPEGQPSPMYAVQLVRTEPANTKTMFVERFEVWVHAVSEPVEPYSSAKVLNLVQALEEAMTRELALPAPFSLYRTECGGLQTLKKDPTNEGHAILSFNFYVCYGLRCK